MLVPGHQKDQLDEGLGLGDTRYQLFLPASWEGRGAGDCVQSCGQCLIHHTCVLNPPKLWTLELGEASWLEAHGDVLGR